MSTDRSEALTERYRDLMMIGVLALIGIGGFVFINLEETTIYPGPGGLSWRSLPFIYSGCLLVLVGIWAFSTCLDIAKLRRGEDAPSVLGMPEVKRSDRTAQTRRAIAFVAIIVYAWAIGAFGFAMTTPILLFVMLRVFGRTDLKANLLVAVIGGLLCWVLFAGILKLPLRGDIWDPLTPILNDLYRMTGLR